MSLRRRKRKPEQNGQAVDQSIALTSLDHIWAMLDGQFHRLQSSIRAIGDKILTAVPRASAHEKLFNNHNGVAIIDISGPMTKSDTMMSMFFGGTSTARVRRAVRNAISDDSVDAILLRISSPGGSVFGTSDLADEVFAARESKRVVAFIEDLGASAAYWVASQADRVVANKTAMVGSIGTFLVVDDWSKMFEKEGIKIHVIKAGEFKGAGTFGTEITSKQMAEWQREIDGLNDHFIAAVARGRGLSEARVRSLADGRVHIGEKAIGADLIDEIGTIEEAIMELSSGNSGVSPGESLVTGAMHVQRLETQQ